jgi:hypothetical protein
MSTIWRRAQTRTSPHRLVPRLLPRRVLCLILLPLAAAISRLDGCACAGQHWRSLKSIDTLASLGCDLLNQWMRATPQIPAKAPVWSAAS